MAVSRAQDPEGASADGRQTNRPARAAIDDLPVGYSSRLARSSPPPLPEKFRLNRAATTSLRQPEFQRLVGSEGNFGEQMGRAKGWVVRIVKRVGNYGEVFERNVGTGSKLGIPRGLNHLWTTGGILYAPPIR